MAISFCTSLHKALRKKVSSFLNWALYASAVTHLIPSWLVWEILGVNACCSAKMTNSQVKQTAGYCPIIDIILCKFLINNLSEKNCNYI